MSKFNQKDGVFNAVCAITNQDSFDEAVELTKEQRASVIEMVTQGLLSGDIDFSDAARAKYDTEAKVKTYTNGLVSNWLRKDRRLNGNVKHFRSKLTDEAHMGKVINIWDAKKKISEESDDSAGYDFAEVMKKNEKRKKRQAKERQKRTQNLADTL